MPAVDAGSVEHVDEEEFITPKEIARRWRCSAPYVYGLLKTGKLPYYALGRQKRVRRIELLEYEQRQRAVDGPVPALESDPKV